MSIELSMWAAGPNHVPAQYALVDEAKLQLFRFLDVGLSAGGTTRPPPLQGPCKSGSCVFPHLVQEVLVPPARLTWKCASASVGVRLLVLFPFRPLDSRSGKCLCTQRKARF